MVLLITIKGSSIYLDHLVPKFFYCASHNNSVIRKHAYRYYKEALEYQYMYVLAILNKETFHNFSTEYMSFLQL